MNKNELESLIVSTIENKDLNKLDSDGMAFIHYAALHNSTFTIEYLFDLFSRGVTIDQKDKHGSTALMIAAREGHLDIVTKLIEAGATVDQADKFGWTALMFAAENGHLNVVTKLIEAGATVDQASKYGSTALMHAAESQADRH